MTYYKSFRKILVKFYVWGVALYGADMVLKENWWQKDWRFVDMEKNGGGETLRNVGVFKSVVGIIW